MHARVFEENRTSLRVLESGDLNAVTGKAPPLVGIKDALYAALLARCADESVLESCTVDVPDLPEGVCELAENTN